jgi:hypothetical protein
LVYYSIVLSGEIEWNWFCLQQLKCYLYIFFHEDIINENFYLSHSVNVIIHFSCPRTLLYISTIGFMCDTLHHICVAPGVYSGRICFILAHFGSLLVCEKKSWAWTSKVKMKLTCFNLVLGWALILIITCSVMWT